jgi:toxin FitB
MIILDTNVLSALMRNVPDVQVVAWLDRQPRASIWTTTVTVFEIYLGLEVMATGKKKLVLSEQFERLLGNIDHRIVQSTRRRDGKRRTWQQPGEPKGG